MAALQLGNIAVPRGELVSHFRDYRRRKPAIDKVGSKVKLFQKIITDGGGHKNCFSAPSFFSRMLLCLKVFCKATNGQCVVVPAAPWSAFCQTWKLSRRKVKQHFYPLWRVNLRKPFVVPLLMKVAELYVVTVPVSSFSARSAGASPPTNPVAMRLLAGSISHNSEPK